MIKKMNYGNIENVVVIQFGFGTTRVVNSAGKQHKSILLGSNDEQKSIGAVGVKHINSDEFKPEVVIVFNSEESFSVFEEFVKNIRKEYDELKNSHL